MPSATRSTNSRRDEAACEWDTAARPGPAIGPHTGGRAATLEPPLGACVGGPSIDAGRRQESEVLSLVKSKQRVADHGEVFTPAWLVEAMLDLVKGESERIDARFLEPAWSRPLTP